MFKHCGIGVSLLLCVLTLIGCGSEPRRDTLTSLSTVTEVDLNRYVGKWYEIARFPNFFQEGCVGTTATYELTEPGALSVVNECRLDSLEGKLVREPGRAEIVDEKTSAKLRVKFSNFPASLGGWGSYWIIGLDSENYEWALVSDAEGRYLWILNRSPQMDDELYNQIVAEAKAKGFFVDQLQRTTQPSP